MSGIIYNDPAFVFNYTGNTISPDYLQNSNQTLFGTGTTQGVTQSYLTSNYYNQTYINSLSLSGGTGGSGTTLVLTTSGFTGPSTYGGGFLNIPQYSGSTSILIPTSVKNSNYSANPNDFVPVDITTGSTIITLPSAPANKTQIGVKIILGSGNTVTINTSGSDVYNRTGGATTFVLYLLGQGATLQYNTTGGIWYVLSDDLPLTQLDSRYVNLTGLTRGIPTSFVSLSGTSGTSTSFMRSDAAPALDQTISPTWIGSHNFYKSSLGVTSSDSIIIGTSTLATSAITQQYSGGLNFLSYGWNAASVASHAFNFRIENEGQTGVTDLSFLSFKSSVNGGAYNAVMTISSSGNFIANSGSFSLTNGFFGNTSTDGLVLNNPAASSLGNPVQKSTRIRFQGSVWNTTPTAAANYFGFTNEAAGISGTTPTGSLDWYSYIGVSTTPTFTKRMTLDTGGNLTLSTGGLNLSNTGKISIATGTTAATAGVTTLIAGTVTVSTTSITANSLIFLSYNTPGGTLAAGLSQGTIVPGTSFVINSLTTAGAVNITDTSRVNWFFIN